MASENTGGTDVTTAAAAAGSTVDVALLLRQLRQRDAHARNGTEQSHHELAHRVGCSPASIGFYLSGVTLPPGDHLDDLARSLGASAQERSALATARERVSMVAPAATAALTVVPRALPPAPAGFVGRAQALAELDAAIGDVGDGTLTGMAAGGPGGPLVISAVAGMAGVGKTALALHWAYRSAQLFPDGQLFVNLRGYDPEEPMTVATALQVLLAALDVPAASLPSDVDERTALYRELLHGRRVLVILDNAASDEQVRALLPPAPGIALVTSRDRLPGLVDRRGARRVTLDALPEADAASLLQQLVGERCHVEPKAVRRLLERCGRLPLALRVAAEIATARPREALADLLAEFESDRPGLDSFETGDARSDLREVFSWSLRSLPAPAAEAFCFLGLAPVEAIDAYGLAALSESVPERAQEQLDVLVRAHLLADAGDGRYRMHDLLRAYALELPHQRLAPGIRDAALHRQLAYYLATTTAATDLRFPYRLGTTSRQPPQSPSEVRTPPLSTPEQATAWLAAERVALVRLVLGATDAGRPEYAVALAFALAPQLNEDFIDDALAVFAAGRAAAVDEIDRTHMDRCLGFICSNLGRIDEAAEHFKRAIATFTPHGDPAGTAPMIGGLGILCAFEGRFEDARTHLLRAQQLVRDAGLRSQ